MRNDMLYQRRSITLAKAAVVVLLAKVLLSIVWEYRWYFPPNFEEGSFLIGRQDTFYGSYAVAFYAHLMAGPVSLVLGALLMSSGARRRFTNIHRWAGRTQAALVFTALVPSSLMMATRTLAGPAAGWGFAALALATAACMGAAIYHAVLRQFNAHQRWASRTFVLLVSPLIFRLVSGILIVFERESMAAYIANAWLSWLVPLLVYELWRVYGAPAKQWWNIQNPSTCVTARYDAPREATLL